MKKALKITGITIASLIGLVLIVVAVALAMVTSSGRLTKMVRKHAPKFVSCEMQIGKADLTLFKTFPNIGVEIENVALINPMAGSPSDTLANIDNLIAVVDARKFLKEKEIIVRKFILEDAFVNIFTNTEGENNLNVFVTKEDNDTLSSEFDYLVDIEEVKLKNATVFYTNDRKTMAAQARHLNLDLKGNMKDNNIVADLDLTAAQLGLNMDVIKLEINDLDLDFEGDVEQMDKIQGKLRLATPDICLDLGEPYLKNDTLNLNLPLQLSLKDEAGQLDKACIGLNKYLINMDGSGSRAENGDIVLDLALNTSTLIIEDVLTYLPQRVQKAMSSVEYSGKIRISEAQVVGTYGKEQMPLITAKVLTEKAVVNVPSLPYLFTDVDLEAALSLDLKGNSEVDVKALETKFNRSKLYANGLIDNLLGDIGLKVKVKGDVPMSDVQRFLPKNMALSGRTDLNLDVDFTIKELMKSLKDYDLNRLAANGKLKIKDFAFDMDTIHADAPMLDVNLVLPASVKETGRRGAYIALASNRLDAQVGKGIKAEMRMPDIKLTADKLKGGFDKMDLWSDLKFSKLSLDYDTIKANVEAPSISVVILPQKSANGLGLRLDFSGKDLAANMGESFRLNTNSLKVKATAGQDKGKSDFLNQWNPTADFTLGNTVVQMAGLGDDIHIHNIDFFFDSHTLDFKKSTISIGRSDLSLRGNVVGVKDWIEDHKNLMKGELQVTSQMLDINEIMDLTSGLGRHDEVVEDEQDKEDNPFMVPEGVDFTFGIHAEKSIYNAFDLNDLGGSLTIKDGTLILREIGFTNKAAEMQLTAMYQSPRKNHLFLAMDFHLLDVQIADLIDMVPYIDTLVPMLKTFDGQAEFHIGAETYLKSNYEPKISTLRAAADIEGKNLSVKDKFAFTQITDMLKVSSNGEYRVDSLDVQLTAFKNEIDLWPSQIAIGKYKVTVDGRMNLDQSGEYHLSVTQTPVFLPNRMGLKLSGPINDLKYDLESPKFPTLYKPDKRNDTEQMYFELKKKIADRLKENVM